MNLIVAVDRNWAIGNKGDLLARVRADLKNFKAVTDGKVVILGSNTLATFPKGKVLPNRVNIVLHPSHEYSPEGAIVAHSIEETLEIVAKYDTRDVFIIGGASIYRQFLPYCDRAYITKFIKAYEADVSIPNLDESDEWECIFESAMMQSDPATDTEAGLAFRFCEYRRK